MKTSRVYGARVMTAVAMAGALLALGACQSGEFRLPGSSGDAPDAPAASSGGSTTVVSADPTGASMDPLPGAAAGSMDELRRNKSVRDQARATLVGQYTKLGDEAFAASDFEAAKKAYANVLDLDPTNIHAKERIQQTGALLGERGFTEGAALGMAANSRRVRAEQAKAEVGSLVRRAQAKETAGEAEGAVALYEKALVITQMYPGTVDFDPTEAGLKAMMGAARGRADVAADSRRKTQLDEARQAARIEAMRERQAREARADELLRQANVAMERERYQLAENLANEILAIDSRNAPAKRLREIAKDARFAKSDDDLQARLLEEWKYVFADLRDAYTPQVADYTFPDSWADLQALRAPPRLSQSGMLTDDPKTREIKNSLDVRKTTVLFQETSIDDAVEYLSRVSNTNIVVLPSAREGRSDDELAIDLKLDTEETVAGILDLLTRLKGLAWNVQDGVVQITTPEEALGAHIVQLYDVKDLATPINNFPSEEINLDPTGEAVFEEDIPEPVPEFLLDRIQGLITQNVDPTVWEEGGSVEGLEPGTLVVKAPPSTHGKIQDLLDGLRGAGGLQVAIETRFVTVEDNFLQEVGVDLRGLGDGTGGIGVPGQGGIAGPAGITIPVTFDDLFFGSAGTPGGIGTANDLGIFYDLNSDGDIRARFENLFDTVLGKQGVLTTLGGLSFQGTLIDDTQLEVILRAVEKSDRSTVVIAPRLTAYNGQRANVTVLNQISYISDFDVEIAQFSQIGDPIVQTLRDGVILDLRPTVTADRRFITMELRPTIALLQRPIATFQTTLANGPPVTIQLPELRIQRVRTTVTMPDGGTLLLGGLKFFEERRLDSTVPWLDKIPVISFFFSRRGTYLEKRNLLVLIRARILRPEENEPGTAYGR